MRLRQRIGSLHLQRVLGSQHKEGWLQLMDRLCYRDRLLLHRFEECRLRLGGRTIDLVCQHEIGKDRPWLKTKTLTALLIFTDQGSTNNISWHEVGGKLDSREATLDHVGEGTNEGRLCQTRYTLKEGVAPS